jgi:hypothetical protein
LELKFEWNLMAEVDQEERLLDQEDEDAPIVVELQDSQ